MALSSWAGSAGRIELDDVDHGAMNAALAIVPELRLAALAVARAARSGMSYPIASTATVAELLHGERVEAGGHSIGPDDVSRFLVPGDLPIEHDGELAAVVYAALQRCSRRHALVSELQRFDESLSRDPDGSD